MKRLTTRILSTSPFQQMKIVHIFGIITIFLFNNEINLASSLALKDTEESDISEGRNIESLSPSNISSLNLLEKEFVNTSDSQKGNAPSYIIPQPDEADTNENVSLSRRKRTLKPHWITRKKEMLFHDKDLGLNESYSDIEHYNSTTRLSTTDFIIRLQEKYEYSVCADYIRSVPHYMNRYFQYDLELVNMENEDDESYKGYESGRQDRIQTLFSTFNYRFRLYDEECDEEAEWYFWRDLFIVAENDTEAVPKKGKYTPPDSTGNLCPDPNNCTTTTSTTQRPDHSNIFNDANLDEYDFVQVEMKDMMHNWNMIWEKYQTRGVCNPQLLLECRRLENEKVSTCKCRINGVGLPTVISQMPITSTSTETEVTHDVNTDAHVPFPENIYTFQYFEDAEENVHSETVRHYGQYVHKKKCVVAASVSVGATELHIINPCDYFLPMIGLCTAECHINATCKSVTKQEHDALADSSKRNQSSKADYFRRIINYKLHDIYHSKCVCNEGHTCQKVVDVTYGQATSIKQQLPNLFHNPTLYLTMIATFIKRYYFKFR